MRKLVKLLPGAAVVLVSLFFLSSFTEAGVFMRSVSKTGDSGEALTVISYIDADRLRIETRQEGFEGIAIFRADKRVFWSINKKEGTYMEMTEEAVRIMEAQAGQMRRQMQEEMAALPPEQRRMMEQMMKGGELSRPSAPKVMVRPVAGKERVNNFPANKYEVYENDKKVMEVWTTDWKNLGLSPADFQAFEKFGQLMKRMGESYAGMSKGYGVPLKEEYGIQGFPVKSVQYEEGGSSYVHELKEVRKQKLAPSLFELPPGLKKAEEVYPAAR